MSLAVTTAAVVADAQALYNKYDMQLVGWWVYPAKRAWHPTSPRMRPAADCKDWKFRSPPGMATKSL